MSLQYIAGLDLMTVTLDSAYTAADGHMHLTAGHGARLPASGDFWIRTTSGTYRCFKVTARSTDDLTVTSAQDGTSDGNLSAGAELKWVLGVTAFDQFRSDLVQTGTDASKSAEKAGKLYLPTDGFALYRDSGSIMAPWGPIFPLTPHDDSGFAWDNQGSASVTTLKGATYISTPAAAGDSHACRVKGKTGTYTITVLIKPSDIRPTSFASFSIGWRESSSGKLILNRLGYNGGWYWTVSKYNSPTSLNSTYFVTNPGVPSIYPQIWLRIQDEGTNRISSWSYDGIYYPASHTIGRTDFITADQVLYAICPNSSDYGVSMSILSWKEE
jgi:hypothetical protein